MAIKKQEGFVLLNKYRHIIRQAQFKIKAEHWIIISAIVSIALFAICFFTIEFLKLPVSQIASLALLLSSIDLMLGYPYLKAMERVSQIEENLPDALKQMADTLKAGGTYEFALREVAISQYGPLSKEIENALRKLEEGENLETSLNSFAESIDSRLIKRSMAVIVDSIKAGAGLADVLDEISNDIREIHRLNRERTSQTLLQVIFIVTAGIMITPVVFGFVATVIELFVRSTAQLAATEADRLASFATKDYIFFLMQAYLLIEVAASSVMISLMREGKISKSIIYFPVLLLIAFVTYYASVFLAGTLIHI
ncbi:MAG: type II secretion system F family protein [Candidatus ainarchaeum sp.]|nr:type II secretion system F family protein [Candidatus ainarchaeum sp.]